MRAVPEHVEVATPAPVLPARRTLRQADDLNQAWAARYRAEREG